MPFQFTGQAPAFGSEHSNAPTGSRSFGFGHTTTANSSADGPGPGSTFGTTSAFGRDPRLWTATSRLPAFGLGGFSTYASDTHNPAAPTSAADSLRDMMSIEALGDDFSEALRRRSKGVKAVFGHKQIVADDLLEGVMAESGVAPGSIGRVLRATQQCPELAAMTRSLFAKVLAAQAIIDPDDDSSTPVSMNAQEKDVMAIFKDRAAPRSRPNTLASKPAEISIAAKESTTLPSQAPLPDTTSCDETISTHNGAGKTYFMDMPTELRLNVYRELLLGKDNHVALRGMPLAKLNKHKVATGIDTSILRANKQIFREAKDVLYKENTVIIVTDVHVSNHPVISKHLMPDHVLSKIVSLVLVCETCTTAAEHQIPHGVDFEKRMIWRQLQDLTALKSLRLIVVERENQKDANEQREDMLASIVQRIPANCSLFYGSKEDAQKTFVAEVLEETNEPDRMKYYDFAWSYEVEADTVKECAEAAMKKVVKGCKSGDTTDYRFPKRTFTLGALGGGGIDPRFVLGNDGN